MDIKIDLSEDMSNSPAIVALLEDEAIATEFYAALCNVDWIKPSVLSEDEQIMDKLKGENRAVWSCSWRYAGGVIAGIRNKHYNTQETYIRYYSSGNEGRVTDLVREEMGKIGWKVHWEYSEDT